MKTPDTDYVDFGFLHCAGEDSNIEDIMKKDIFDYVRELKSKGIIRHIGFSSHTPSVANRLIDTGLIDMMMFSINPAYDLERGDKMAHDHYSKLTVRAYTVYHAVTALPAVRSTRIKRNARKKSQYFNQ